MLLLAVPTRLVHIHDDVLLLVQAKRIQRVELIADLVQELKNGRLLVRILVIVDHDHLGSLVLVLLGAVLMILLAGVLVPGGTRTTWFWGGWGYHFLLLLLSGHFLFLLLLLLTVTSGWAWSAPFVLVGLLVALSVVHDDHLLVTVCA